MTSRLRDKGNSRETKEAKAKSFGSVFLAKQAGMPDVRVYKDLHSRVAMHNVQKRSTLL